MNKVLQEIFDKGQVTGPDGKVVRIHSGILREEGQFLKSLIAEVKPSRSLEIGLAHGVSSLFICEALEENGCKGKHIAVDPFQLPGRQGFSWEGVGLNNIKNAGYADYTEFYGSPAHMVLPKLESEGVKADLIFIDGMHTFDYVLVDLFLSDKILNVGGLVILHDCGIPSIQKVCRYIVRNLSYKVHRCFYRGFPPFSFSKDVLVKYLKSIYIMSGIFSLDFLRYRLNKRSYCIAFKKEAEDRREWDMHVPF